MAPNSELGLQFSTTTAAIAAASDAAWHVLSLLLSLGHPALPDELASKCKLFYSTPNFILFLCSIPNSPLRLAEDQFVTISQTGFDAIAQYFANSVTMTTFLDLPQFVPRLLQNVRSNGVLRTYSRKRKRLMSEIDDFSVSRKRRFFQDFNVDKNLNKIVLSMPGALQTICGQGNILDGNANKTVATLPHVTSVLAFDCRKLEKVMCASSSFINYCPGRLDCETKNVDQGDGKMEDNFCSREELCCLPQTRCQTDFLFGGRLQNLLTTKLAEKMMISVPHPEISLIPCLTDNSEVSKCDDTNIINPITNINHSNPCWLEVEQKMTFSQAEGEAQPCGLLIENVYRNTEEVLPPESDNCLGLRENLPLDKSHIDEYDIDIPGKSEANNVVLSPNRTRTEVHMQSNGDMLQHLVKSSSAPNADQKDATSRKKEGTCQTMENMKCIGPLKEEPQTFRRDKKPIAVKQKTKCNADLHIKSKGKRETSMENRKKNPSTSINNHNEQKPFPNFESYIVQEEEGSGGYGTVYRARRKSDGVTFAIKCPHVNAHRSIVHNEMKMLERLGGKNFVIKYEGSIKSGSSDCLVLEHVEHDRPEALKREINIFQLQWYGYCLFKALASLHKQSIVHRDVKPGNFLFSRTVNKGYLIDFNLALDLNRKHGSIDDRKTGYDVNFDHSPIPRTKSLPPAKERKFTTTSVPEAAHQNARKGSKSLLPPGNLKKKADKANFFTDSSSRNIIRAQGTDGSVITSTKDATSTRTPSAERLREPVPCQGRKELISLVQEALQGGNNESVNAPTSKRKRVAAPPRNAESNFLYPTPMPLHARGMVIGGAGILKSNGKHKREGPCVGTKGFRAPEVLFRSLYQGPKVDIWSAGVTLLYLITGRTPFFGDPDENIKEIAKLRGSEDLWEVAKLHNHESLFPTDLLDVKYLSALKLRDWCVQNTRRPDFLEAIPKSLFDLVDKCLTVNPRLRINAEEALRHEFFTPCHEALRKQRLQRQGHSLETGTSRLLVRRESQSSEWLTQKSGQLENTQAPRNTLHP